MYQDKENEEVILIKYRSKLPMIVCIPLDIWR